jgi:hypothetical protein
MLHPPALAAAEACDSIKTKPVRTLCGGADRIVKPRLRSSAALCMIGGAHRAHHVSECSI